MTLWRVLQQSLYAPAFYRELLRERDFRFSLSYYLSILIILAVLVSVPLSAVILPRLNDLAQRAAPLLAQSVPDGAVLELSDGQASINQPEPFIVPLPSTLGVRVETSTLPATGTAAGGAPAATSTPRANQQNLLVVDTKANSDQFDSYNTILLITKDSLVSREDDRIVIMPLSQLPDGSFDKAYLQELTVKFQAVGRWLAPIVVFGSFLVSFGLLSLTLGYLLLAALFILGMARLRGLKIGYLKAYQVGLHALSPALVVYSLGLVLLGQVFSSVVPSLMFAVMLVIAWVNLFPWGRKGKAA